MLLFTRRSSSGVSGPPQPLFANVKYLPDHQNALNASTALTDLATGGTGNPHVFTFDNQAKNDTGDSAFGSGSSLLLDGVDDRIFRDNHPDFRPESAQTQDTGEFCFEAHIKLSTVASADFDIMTRYKATTNQRIMIFRVLDNGSIPVINLLVWFNGTTLLFDLKGTSAIAVDTWHHVAVSRENDFSTDVGAEDIVRIFVDGIEENSLTLATAEGMNEVSPIGPRFGDRESGGGDFPGRIDNIRITLDEPIYKADFSPLTARHPTS